MPGIKFILLLLIVIGCQAQSVVSFVRGPGSASSPNDLLNGLVAFWEFEETSGNASDAHSGGRTLTQNGTIESDTGIRGNSRVHDDSEDTDYFSRASDVDLTFGSGDFTVTCWVRLGSITGDQALAAKSDEVNGLSWLLEYDDAATDNFSFFWSTDGSSFLGPVVVTPSGGVGALTWYFVTVRRSGGTVLISATSESDIVVDAEVSGAISGTLSDNSTVPVTVGSYLNTGAVVTTHDLGGKLDELGIWKGVALTTCQLDELFNASNALDYSLFNNDALNCENLLLNQNGFALLNQDGGRLLMQ